MILTGRGRNAVYKYTSNDNPEGHDKGHSVLGGDNAINIITEHKTKLSSFFNQMLASSYSVKMGLKRFHSVLFLILLYLLLMGIVSMRTIYESFWRINFGAAHMFEYLC